MSSAALRIFLVEDHPDTLKYLKMYLEQSGHVVESARTVKQAVASLASAEFDVVLSDIALADGSGWNLLDELKPPKPNFAIAMSGFGTAADASRSRAAGYRHHLVKPIDPDMLDQLLDEARREKDRT